MRLILASSSLAVTMFTATPALAHTESLNLSSSFFSGLLHPFTGVDHFIAMIAFGIWFSLQDKGNNYLPGTLLAMLVAGFAIGVAGFSLPFIEGGILCSILVTGLLVASAAKLCASLSYCLIGVFALFHGVAHGAEIGSALAVLFMVGFILTCGLVIAIASKASLWIQTKSPNVIRFIGLIISMTGLSLIAA